MTDEERAKDMIMKVEAEKIISDAIGCPIECTSGYDIIGYLMSLSIHDCIKTIGKILSKFDEEFSTKRPEGWRIFSDKVSKAKATCEDYKSISPKTKRLRDAAYLIALIADCFEYIEKAELK